MPAGVILDTSFLISLANPERAGHAAARKYWQHFVDQAMPLFLPTIVVSEFCLKQELPPDILRACIVLPFNWDDAIKAAGLDFTTVDRAGESRVAVKDDVKIIAQAIVKDAAWIITDDSQTFHRYAQQLVAAGKAPFRAIRLEDGFDPSLLNPDGQHQMKFASDEDEKPPQE